MSIINRNNYEIYFLDYLEGNLNPELKQEMELFLLANPDLKEELDGLEDAVLPDDKIVFQAKQSLKNLTLLKRPERFESDDEFLIAKIEGDLSSDEEMVFNSYIKGNQLLEKEYSLYLLTRLQVDESIVFENKSLLYKHEQKDNPLITSRPLRFQSDDEFLVAKIEGELTPGEDAVFVSYIRENPAIDKEYSLYKQTILQPDQSVVYEHKSSLKRLVLTTNNHLLRKYSLAVASIAAILLFITIFFFDRKESQLTPGNNNFLSLIHPSLENNENIISGSRISFSGVSEKKLTENEVIKIDVKSHQNLQVYTKPYDSSINNSINGVSPIKTEHSISNKVINPDVLQVNQIQDNLDNKKVPDISKQIVNAHNDIRNQSKSTKSTSKKDRYDKGNLTFWDLAVMGVRGLSNLSGKKIELKQQYDADGNVKSLAFNSPNIEFSTPVKKR